MERPTLGRCQFRRGLESADVAVAVLANESVTSITQKLKAAIDNTSGFTVTLGSEAGTVLIESNARFYADVLTPNPTKGEVRVSAQLRFTDTTWSTAQTVVVMAIDDDYVDGSDVMVFAAPEPRANVLRGPVSVEGGEVVGSELFFQKPVLLPRETNFKLADGTVAGAGTNSAGLATLRDLNATHLNAATGLRPGFDPRMNDFLYYFTLLNGPAKDQRLTVKSVSQDILSVANAQGINLGLTYSGSEAIDILVRLYGTPTMSRFTQVTWDSAVLTFDGTVENGDQWSLALTGAGTYEVSTAEAGTSIGLMAATLVEKINDGRLYTAELRIGLRGEANVLIDRATPFTVALSGKEVGIDASSRVRCAGERVHAGPAGLRRHLDHGGPLLDHTGDPRGAMVAAFEVRNHRCDPCRDGDLGKRSRRPFAGLVEHADQ